MKGQVYPDLDAKQAVVEDLLELATDSDHVKVLCRWKWLLSASTTVLSRQFSRHSVITPQMRPELAGQEIERRNRRGRTVRAPGGALTGEDGQNYPFRTVSATGSPVRWADFCRLGVVEEVKGPTGSGASVPYVA